MNGTELFQAITAKQRDVQALRRETDDLAYITSSLAQALRIALELAEEVEELRENGILESSEEDDFDPDVDFDPMRASCDRLDKYIADLRACAAVAEDFLS